MPLMYEPCPDAIYPEGESLTEQEHAAECDINRIWLVLKLVCLLQALPSLLFTVRMI